MEKGSKKRFVVIDGKSVFYRGFYAMPYLKTASGLPTGGVYGFALMSLEVIKRLNAKGIFVGLSGDGIFCAENHKPIVDATMREVGLEFAMKDYLHSLK